MLDRRRFLKTATTLIAVEGLAAKTRGAVPREWGDLTGRFVYDGPPPPRKKLTVDKDVEFCGKFDIRDPSLIVAADGGLANVYVYIRSRDVPISPGLQKDLPSQVVLDNRDAIFQPHCLKIWYTHQEFSIINSDPIAQNVAFSPLGDTPANIVLPVGGKATHKFTRRQNVPVKIACNYHPWESGYILPRDNPYMAVSASDGSFRIDKLPTGTWEFQAWHERLSYMDTPKWPKGRFTLTIRPGDNTLGTIRLAPSLWSQP